MKLRRGECSMPPNGTDLNRGPTAPANEPLAGRPVDGAVAIGSCDSLVDATRTLCFQPAAIARALPE